MTDVTSVVPAPDGYIVDFDSPQRLADQAVYWCFGFGMLLSILFTAQRVYVKWALQTPWQLDDSFIAVSWLASLATQALVVRGFADKLGGVHIWDMSIDQFNDHLLTLYIAAIIYIVAGSCMKIAILIFYLRISPQQTLHICVYASIVVITGYSIGLVLAFIFACDPIEKSFNVLVTEGRCLNSAALYIATAAVNILSDVILFILPIVIVSGLQMPLKEKAGLVFIFGIGSATIITSILRAALLPALLSSKDPSWDVAHPALLIVIESNLIIICGMLPTLRKFFRHVAPKFLPGGANSVRSNAAAADSKSSKKAGLTPAPAEGLVTFGSLPSKRGQRGYAKFGSGPDGYPLEMIKSCGEDVDAQGAPFDARSGARRSQDLERAGGDTGVVVTTHIQVTYEKSGEDDMVHN